MPDILVEMKNITKSYHFSDKILDNVDFTVYKGMVHALVGANGSGKTTLMKILAGMIEADEAGHGYGGDIYIDGKRSDYNSIIQAQEQGIYMVSHETGLFQELNVYENMYINKEPVLKFGPFSMIQWKKIYQDTNSFLKKYGLDINPAQKVRSLTAAQQRTLEVIRAMVRNARVLIIDESAVYMDKHEMDAFYQLIAMAKGKQTAVIYISHRIEEIMNIADYVSVLKDGKIAATMRHDETTARDIIKMLAGRTVRNKYPKMSVEIGQEVLSVRNVKSDFVKDLSFSLNKGEIIGLAGLRGSGRTTLAEVLFGAKSYRGEIEVGQQRRSIHSTESAVKNGICYIGGSGIDEGLFHNIAISENITSVNMAHHRKRLTKSFKRYIAAHYIDLLNIKASGGDEIVKNLSAGNKKKVLLAKWLFSNSQIFIFNQPTANMDAASKIDIYNIFNELLRKGCSIIMISNDFSELIGMCDRILVMSNGRIVKELDQQEATEELIMHYASEEV